MHLLSLVSSLFSKPEAPKREAAEPNGGSIDSQLAAMGRRLHIAPRAVRAERAKRILWATWAQRYARGEETRAFDAFLREAR